MNILENVFNVEQVECKKSLDGKHNWSIWNNAEGCLQCLYCEKMEEQK